MDDDLTRLDHLWYRRDDVADLVERMTRCDVIVREYPGMRTSYRLHDSPPIPHDLVPKSREDVRHFRSHKGEWVRLCTVDRFLTKYDLHLSLLPDPVYARRSSDLPRSEGVA